MGRSLADIIAGYQRNASLAEASTIPAEWYTDPRVLDLERRTVFSRAWQAAGRIDQLQRPGQYVACETAAGEPIVLVRGSDEELRGFFNVCRHHAAAVATAPEGSATHLRCPYHGWTYSLEGELKGTPDFAGVCDFDRVVQRPGAGRHGRLGELGISSESSARALHSPGFSVRTWPADSVHTS